MTKITKAEFDALPESLKSKFTADGDGYSLIEEDVEGLKKSKADILKEKKDLQDRLTAYEAKEAEEKAKTDKAEQDLLVKTGEFEKAQKARDDEWQKRLDTITVDKDSLFADVHRERLTNELVKRNVLPDRAAYLVGEMLGSTELFKNDAGEYGLRKKGGIGDAAEFDGLISTAKEKTPFFFAASTQSGGGASGGTSTGGETDFSKMSTAQKLETAFSS